jgi:UDP-N-acetylmuramoyl-L-alanyl-D-glutamate--2,6-diaminopimelate ligase
MAQYFEMKLKLFTEYEPKNIVVNARDPYGKIILESSSCKNKIQFNLIESDFYPKKYELSASGIKADIQTPEKLYSIESPMIGVHNLENLLAVMATCYGLEIPLEKVVENIAKIKMPLGRLQKIQTLNKKAAHVFVDYAHSDDALKNVLQCLNNIKTADQKIWTVFGCGGDRDSDKRPKMAAVASELSDFVMVTSDNPRKEDPHKIIQDILGGLKNKNFECEVDRKKAIESVLSKADERDIVLVAGKGHENYQIIGETKYMFDDSAVIKEYYER